MSKKLCVKTFMDSEHVKASETKHCINLHGRIFVIFLMTQKENQLEKLCFSSIGNLETVC